MCGIAGYVRLAGTGPPDEPLLEQMLGLLTHRGPDEFGVYLDDTVGLGSARLSIIDLGGGTQPISNEDETVWIVFNGEIYNHAELRTELEGRRHRFTTRTDTEVIVHLYEELGPRCVERLNGQFAFAIWDRREPELPKLVLARDRVGIRPLFVATVRDTLLFASEVKSLFAHPGAVRRLDADALHQVFTFWTTLGPRTPFVGVQQLLPAHVMVVAGGRSRITRYWDADFEPESSPRSLDEYSEELLELLRDATRRRLNADVAVGAYLSGGLDSSTITRIATEIAGSRLQTFSVGFEHPEFDEQRHQALAVAALGTEHTQIECRNLDIAGVFPDVVWHAEWPILRTAPAPMFLLSGLVHEHGIKVVLTGEGADEVLAGYNIFKEDKIRRFWARAPDSRLRPLLLGRLYPYVTELDAQPGFLPGFFGRRLTEVDRLDYSHVIRWLNTSHLRRMLSADVRERASVTDPIDEVTATLASHPRFGAWTPLARAQYIEMTIFMSGYLLSSQGDRMLMSHSVEGRFPFLDHRVIELAGRMPDRAKLCGLDEKHVLKRAMRGRLPDAVVGRVKQPFRAPIEASFAAADYTRDVLAERSIRDAGIFEPRAVAVLAERLWRAARLGERDNMALAGVISTMVLHDHFVARSPQASARQIRLARRRVGGLTHVLS